MFQPRRMSNNTQEKHVNLNFIVLQRRPRSSFRNELLLQTREWAASF